MQPRRLAQAVVVVETQAELETGVAGLDVVLDVRRLLLDRRGLGVGERLPVARQIVGEQVRIVVGTRRGSLKPGSVMPNVKFSSSFVALMVPPNFRL